MRLTVPDPDPGRSRALAEQLGARVGLAGVLADLDRRTRPAADRATGTRGFTWDRRDARSRTWWPQGLTLSADAAGRPSTLGIGDRRVLLAGWYAKGAGRARPHVATRVSVVDLDAVGAPGYAHVLLVQAHRDESTGLVRHRPVPVHAGGLVWLGDMLLVADTRRGVRVFDLGDVVRPPRRTGLPRGVRHLLPQRAAWLADGDGDAEPLRWSFLSLDRTVPGTLSLVAGEYAAAGTGARLARWALDPGSGEPARSEPDEVLTPAIASMQGAVRVEGTYVVSASDGARRRGHLWTGPAGGPYAQHSRVLPVGPEDLAYDPATRRVWTQTEYRGRRLVLSLPVPHRHPPPR